MRTFKETSKIVEEVANIALQAAEEKGLTFREVLYLPEMIDARIKKEIEKKGRTIQENPAAVKTAGRPTIRSVLIENKPFQQRLQQPF